MDAFDAIREESSKHKVRRRRAGRKSSTDRPLTPPMYEKEAMRRSILDEKVNALTDVRLTRSVLSGVKSTACLALMALLSSLAVKLNPCLPGTLGTRNWMRDYRQRTGTWQKNVSCCYNFPRSLPEAKAQRGVGRRKVGLGHLTACTERANST